MPHSNILVRCIFSVCMRQRKRLMHCSAIYNVLFICFSVRAEPPHQIQPDVILLPDTWLHTFFNLGGGLIERKEGGMERRLL